ncbi:MAG: hypothetical protein RMZ42_15465 [Nostoc sp. DedQUE05]|uniref:hypothetical protein n=1 Tax=Nostoc sp. DedQUE05 TaxID=3075391 RepID=UPI002AD5A909|nr:hypothetical protein [Nostoc sp. DedQUE05]MDZ8093312.1 hypothetical protein [Nostoc sp. DedQUE05]
MCSNAFVQAIALALSGDSAVGRFSDLYTPDIAASWRLATCRVAVGLKRLLPPSIR